MKQEIKKRFPVFLRPFGHFKKSPVLCRAKEDRKKFPLPFGKSAEYPHMVHLLKDEAQIKNDILEAKENADFIIVFVHWGTEYALQPFEILTGSDGHKMLIYYSIDNFISSQSEVSCIKGGKYSTAFCTDEELSPQINIPLPTLPPSLQYR